MIPDTNKAEKLIPAAQSNARGARTPHSDDSTDAKMRISAIAPNPNVLEGQWPAYLILFVLGLGNLLPWNAFITASSYYQNRFCGTVYENSFESFFSMFYTVSQPIGLLATIFFKKRVTTKALVLYPLMVYASVFVLTTLLVVIPDVPQAALFAITLMCTFACGLCGAVMNGGLFGLSGILPAEYTGALMIGQGLAGTSVSAINLLIVAVSHSGHGCHSDDGADDDDGACEAQYVDFGALAYFLVATCTLLLCIVLFRHLLHLDYVRHFMKLHLREHLLVQEDNPMWTLNRASDVDVLVHMRNSASQPALPAPPIADPNLSSEGNRQPEARTPSRQNPSQERPASTGSDASVRQSVSDMLYSTDSSYQLSSTMLAVQPMTVSNDLNQLHVTWAEIGNILRKIQIPAISVCLVFAGTLCVFPSVIVMINARHDCSDSPLFDELWIPFLFLVLNVCDFTGRALAPHLRDNPIVTPRTIWMFAAVRFVLPVMICLSNIEDSRLPIVSRNDGVTIFLTALLGFTNGSLANLSMMFGPALVPSEQASLAGTIMIFCLSAGLLIGACLSFLLLYIILG